MTLALGVPGWAEFCRDMKALGERTTARQKSILARHGYRHANHDESGAHYQ
jgi:hypothetical protein